MVRGHTPDLAWRLMDAQHWASPRLARRQRVFVVADFGGQCSHEILFKPRAVQSISASGGDCWLSSACGDRGSFIEAGRRVPITRPFQCYRIDSEEALGRVYIEEMEMLDVPDNVLPYFDFEAYGRDVRINEGGHFAPGGYVFNNGGSFVERYHGMEDIPPEHRIFAYPKLNIREQMAAYQEVIDRSALNEEKLRLPTSREDR